MIQHLTRLFFTLSILTAETAVGAELYESYVSARAAGMGNAYTAVVKGEESIFYNPAGLGRMKGFELTLVNLGFGANGTEASSVSSSYSDADTTSGFADFLRDFYGTRIWVNGQGRTGLAVGGLGVAAWGAFNVAAAAGNPAYPTINTSYIQDVGIGGGYGYELVPDIFSFGLVAKRITRTGARFPIGMETLVTLSDSDLSSRISNTGTGYGLDAGVTLSIPVAAKPTVSAVWKNMGTTRFSATTPTTRPPSIENEIIFGFGMEFETMLLDVRPVFDYKHAFKWDEQLGKKVHGGIELGFPLIAVRAGLHQGYYTAGASVDLALLRADVATYGVELGEYPGQHEDRRYVFELSFKLGWDGEGLEGIFGGGGDGSAGGFGGIKQRR